MGILWAYTGAIVLKAAVVAHGMSDNVARGGGV